MTETVPKPLHNRIVRNEELMLRLQRGDEWVFQLLVRRFNETVFSVAFGITLDVRESQEILKEVFQSVYDRVGSFDGEISLNALLSRVIVHRCFCWKRRWRRRFPWRTVSADNTERLVPAASDRKSFETADRSGLQDPLKRKKEIDNTMKRLPEAIRTVYVLREMANLSYEEIAAALDIRVGVVRTRMFHARKKLFDLLQPVAEV